MPVKKYINQKRIAGAQELCAVKSLSVKEIAGFVGYRDFPTFYRNFRKFTGGAPDEYRQTVTADQ